MKSMIVRTNTHFELNVRLDFTKKETTRQAISSFRYAFTTNITSNLDAKSE